MAIYRVGPSPDMVSFRMNLGRVLVTIDDLHELLELMRRDMAKPADLKVQFSGGYFTDAQDLSGLTDTELKMLRLRGDNVEVILTPDEAYSIGTEAAATAIYNEWAREREIIYPAATTVERIALFIARASALLLAAVLLFVVLILLHVIALEFSQVTVYTPIPIVGVIGLAIGMFINTAAERVNWSRAHIHPMTRQSYRDSRFNSRWDRWTVVVGIVGIVIGAAVSIAVAAITT